MKKLCFGMLIVVVGCGLAIGGRRLSDGVSPPASGPTSPAVFGPEIMDQTGLVNAIVEAVGVKITSSTYDSWSMRLLIAGMMGLFGIVLRERSRASLSDAATSRLVRYLETYRNHEGVGTIIESLKRKDDKIEKQLHKVVKRETGP